MSKKEPIVSTVQEVNLLLASDTSGKLFRLGAIAATTATLRATGRYCGVRYLYEHEVPANELPGNANGSNSEVDPTRLAFIV